MERGTNGGATRFARRSTRIRLFALVGALAAMVVVGTGCPPPDTTPPGPVTNLEADAGDAEVALTWTNPTDADFAGVKIQRRTDACPSSPTDGTTAFEGFAVNFTDTGLTNNQVYFYAVFAYDGVPNYSWGATVFDGPQESQTVEILMEELRELSRFINTLPTLVLADDDKEELVELVEDAEDQYEDDDPCGAALVLAGEQGYLPIVQTLRMEAVLAKSQEGVDAFEGLYARGRTLRYEMLLGRGCEGEERVGEEATAEAEEEECDNTEMAGKYEFGEPILRVVEDGGEVFTKVELPGADSTTGEAGLPGVPGVRRLIALPSDAEMKDVTVEVIVGEAETFDCNLYPTQEQAADQDEPEFYEPEFVKDDQAYDTDGNFPGWDYHLTPLGDYRDLQMAVLEVPAGQYNPAKDELVLYDSVEVKVDFGTDAGSTFVSEAALNAFELPPEVYTGPVLNRESLLRYVAELGPILRVSGEEFMILTPELFWTEAIALRDWKRSKGIWTNVYQVGDTAALDTAAEIDLFIHNHYYSVFNRPSYILLLGDAEHIPPFYPAANNPSLVGDTDIGSDWPYAILGTVGVDKVPDFAVGRLPVDTTIEANTVVQKIINYEDNPPSLASFYSNATVASQFQCCRTDVAQDGTAQRTFAEVSEFCRNAMMAQGKTVDRLYKQTIKTSYSSTGRDTTPRRYFDGTLLPFDLGPLGAYDWTQTELDLRTDLITAWNAGRFLVIHRDHGWQYGWSHPQFETSHLASLTNTNLLPVVFSVNCASGLFDNETDPGVFGTTTTGTYFCEQLLRKTNGGAVGILGDSRNSPSWPNTSLLQGYMDAIWPNTLPAWGGATVKRRLGDILNHGKLYMMTQIASWSWMAGSADANDELLLWHCLGDPTLEIWRSNPNWLTAVIAVYELRAYLLISTEDEEADGAVVTAYQNVDGEFVPIGRGVMEDGSAKLLYLDDGPNPAYDIQVAIGKDDAVTQRQTVPYMAVKVLDQ